jgi:type 2 lantibiotic biosynthesis protein LanM
VVTHQFSEQDLRVIVAAASTIDERLTSGFLPDAVQTTEETVNTRIEAWCQAVAKGDWEMFHQRLAYDGLDVDMIRRILGSVQLPEETPLPSWADTLQEMLNLAAIMSDPDAADERYGRPPGFSPNATPPLLLYDPKRPLPFEEILAPFVVVARQRYAALAAAAYHLLSDEAHITLQRSLLQTLATIAAQALYLEFSIEQAQAQSGLERLLAQAQNDASQTLYRQFVRDMCRGRLVAFFQEYAVLARLLATVTDLWVEATVEFLKRLSSDWLGIQRVFGAEGELGQVTSVQPSLSDPHQGRRRVIALSFASGLKLIYKPKNLGTEEAYQRLLVWCNQRGAPLPFKVLTVFNRSSHGWVEFVEQEPCRNQAEAQRYYRRAGMLLCLIYVIEGTDCHHENLIANGEYPVLVDLETLLHHRSRLEEREEEVHARLLAYRQLAYSVLRTGLLPSWQIRNDERVAYDLSGLGDIDEKDLLIQIPQWMRVNTDRMALEYELVKMEGRANKPMLESLPLRLEEYTGDVVAGFQQMYQFLLDQRETLLAAESPLHALAPQQVRFVYRGTRVYSLILQKLLDPKHLHNGADRSIQLELLGRAVLPLEDSSQDKGKKSRWWPVFAAERRAMEHMDIPFFIARASSDALVIASDQEIEACFGEPSFDLVLARLKTLGDEDLERQTQFICGSLYTHIARDVASVPVVQSADEDVGLEVTTLPTPDRLVAQALAIAEQITTRAIHAVDGSAAWIAPHYLYQARRYQLQPLGYDLYNGVCGVALFLAAVEKVSGDTEYHRLTLGALQPLRKALRDYGQHLARELSIGGATGLGSIVYVLTRVSQWLDEPALLEDAKRAADLITTERITDDRALDIVAGAAGAILGLLALYDESLDQAVLDRARACGQHLLQVRTKSAGGYLVWLNSGGRCLTGFSHGAAGIAYSLLRLYTVTQEAAILAAAREGIIYEDSLFAPIADNWPDLREEEQPAYMTSWCHGAPGIALARIGGLTVLDTDQIRKDIEIGLQTTQRCNLQNLDHLCCGNLGRADILLEAANRLSRPQLAETARGQAWNVVARAELMGSFLLHPLLPKQVYCPDFFQGTAGIGYTLLRMAHPNVLPSLLLWE